MIEWDEKLCIEKHKRLDETAGRLDEEVQDLYKKRDELIQALNGKFNKIMFGIFATLLTVVGSLITIIVTRIPIK